MQVILLDKVANLGSLGDQVNVKAGYARNFLVPQANQAITHSITVGSRITVQGFISCHKAKNGLSKMVLHAEQIELIDSGD